MPADHREAAERIRRLTSAARKATGKLRDAARTGTVIEFRQRDPLVIAIHKALQAADDLAAVALGGQHSKIVCQPTQRLATPQSVQRETCALRTETGRADGRGRRTRCRLTTARQRSGYDG